MSKRRRVIKKIWLTGLIISLLILTAPTVFAKNINLSDMGIIPWVVVIVGVILVLLQLIPAAIILFSTVGIVSSLIFKRKKATEKVGAEEEEIVSIPGYEPQLVRSEFEK